MTEPRVTVIIPIFNREHLLERSLGSVLSQTVRDIEVLVVDDHSDTPLDAAIEGFADPRVTLLRLPARSGVSLARNAGIKRARAPFIAFLDSDDAWLAQKLAAQLAFLDAHPAIPLVHTEEIWIRGGVRVNPKRYHQKSGGRIFVPSLRRCLISPSAAMLRKQAFSDFGAFDPALPVCEDYDLWLRITCRSDIGFIETPLVVKYGGHADQLSAALPAMDRYRIQSMLKLVRETALRSDDLKEVWTVIHEKASVLLQGATKRNLPEAALYRQWCNDASVALRELTGMAETPRPPAVQPAQ
jgi:glycosyltransferase involved in cell wall biosynthesis